MSYPFDGLWAIDPLNPSNVAPLAEVTIFSPADLGRSPIAITDDGGLSIPNPVTTNEKGFAGAFRADIPKVGWEAGGLSGFITSFEGLKQDTEAAAAAAEASRAEAALSRAAAEAAAAQALAPADEAVADALETEGTRARSAVEAVTQAALVTTKAEITQLQQTTPSLEELCATGYIAVAIDGVNPVSEFTWAVNFTTFIAPFPLRILSADLMFDRWALAANDTNYATIILRRMRAGAAVNIATKTTKANGGEAVATRTAWGYAGATWNTANRDFLAGDAVNFAFSFTGSGVKAVLPVSATIRYAPL